MISTGIHCYKGGSGKSTTAIGLAAETARSGKKVLLIDGDFGVPAQAITLRADAAQTGIDLGLADFYIGRVPLQNITRKPNLAKLSREFPEADLKGLERLFVIPPGNEAIIEFKDDINFNERIKDLFNQAQALGFDEVFVDFRGGSHRYSVEAMLAIERPIVVGNDQEIEVKGMVNTLESYRRYALRELFGHNQTRLAQFVEKTAYACALSKIKNLPSDQQTPLINALQESFKLSSSKVRDVLHRTLIQMYQERHPGQELTEDQQTDLMYRSVRLLPRSTEEYLRFAEAVVQSEKQRGAKTDYDKVLDIIRYFATNAAGVVITRVKDDTVATTAFDRVRSLANAEGLGVRYIGFFSETKDAKNPHYFLQPAFVNGTTGSLDELLRRPEIHKNLARVDLLKLKRQYDLAYGVHHG